MFFSEAALVNGDSTRTSTRFMLRVSKLTHGGLQPSTLKQ